ncbi:alpha,alpha-trehalose-phosphate synthase (UDP-forming) [Halosolutus gelatinilyticus]|uniref:alpha,alpha-trehalose-phosphate synthase (UDP-forming) n=1 Tax=Halosolutus gelatinilyticus TaxID=2931975 RepID=UPI001FF49343|nr:trehalose-6-phosphate synthase [Halosolutus gelatinilyticus]
MVFPEERSSSPTRPWQCRIEENGRSVVDTQLDESVCPGSLIVVSNRQPYRHEYDEATDHGSTAAERESEQSADGTIGTGSLDDRSITVDEPTGGLTAGLDPVIQHVEGTWIAWGDGDADFAVTDDRNCVAVPPDAEAYTLHRIDLSEDAVEAYYRGFSNRVLWPLCHEFPDLVEHRDSDFEWYRTVNQRFADAAVEHASADSVIWLQDYHFALASQAIRRAAPDSVTIAQFWHIPWPPADTFRHCPAGKPILEGLLGNDLLGFHVDRYVDAFLECADRFLPAADVDRETRTVRHDGSTTRVVATPMGVHADSYARNARSASVDLGSTFEEAAIPRGCAVGLGVDRLDYSKGIPERFAAIERFFERHPGWRGEFTFVQKATPSRTEIETYQQYGEFVRSEADRINRRFARPDWQPIVYIEEYISNETLAGLYRHSDVMVVSALRDGMNLVAQEYVAASIDGNSCLLLSDRTGVHDRLGSHALTIDPTDTEGVVDQLERALTMPPHERQYRMNALRSRVFDGDLESWMGTQFDWIRRVHADGARERTDAALDRERNRDHDRDSHEPTPPV